MSKTPPTTPDTPRFEDQLAQLEALVRRLEQGDLPLEEALTVFTEGNALVKACRAQLEEVEMKVEQVIAAQEAEADGRRATTPFEDA